MNLQFFPVQPSSLGLKGASSPFFVAPARRNRWHFSGSLLVSKENIPRLYPSAPAERPCTLKAGRKLIPQRRAFAESGAAPAVSLHDPTRENAMPERPQTLRHCSIKNNFSAIYAQSEAERIKIVRARQALC